jgi:hypothetical protein
VKECICCGNQATRILVNYHHEIIDENQVFCELHAFNDSREKCPCCDDYVIETYDDNDRSIELLPTYVAGSMDSDGCCSDHP